MDTEEKSDIYQSIPTDKPNIIYLRNTPGFLAFIENIEISINKGDTMCKECKCETKKCCEAKTCKCCAKECCC